MSLYICVVDKLDCTCSYSFIYMYVPCMAIVLKTLTVTLTYIRIFVNIAATPNHFFIFYVPVTYYSYKVMQALHGNAMPQSPKSSTAVSAIACPR